MASTDIEQRIVEAVVAILEADAGVQAITGRTLENILPWQDSEALTYPVLLYLVPTINPYGGAGDTRLAEMQITAVADGEGAGATTRALLERVELGLTQPLLAAQSLDAAVIRSTRRGATPEGSTGSRGTTRADIILTIYVTK